MEKPGLHWGGSATRWTLFPLRWGRASFLSLYPYNEREAPDLTFFSNFSDFSFEGAVGAPRVTLRAGPGLPDSGGRRCVS